MARKAKNITADADGYLRTGIYQRYVGQSKPEHRLTAESAKAYVERLNAPVTNELARIKDWLGKIILPWVEGPLTDQEAMKPVGRACYSFDFGGGDSIYRNKPELQRQEQCVIDAVRDAIQAWHEMRVIEHNLKSGGMNVVLFRSTFRLGQLCERIGVRPFERAAKIGLDKSRKSAENAKATNEKRAARRPDYNAAVKQRMERGMKYDPACQDVANEFDVTKETVRNNTPKLRPKRPT